MSGFLDDAHHAWTRLRAWESELATTADGRSALHALVDIGTVRRLLDQAEVTAVRAARAAGESWSEIAARAGISRQSAWERWRDLDDDAPAADQAADPAAAATAAAAGAVVSARLDERTPRGRRRRLVEVPDVVGMAVQDALGILTRTGLDAVSATPELPLLAPAGELRSATVVRQYPDSGTRVRGTTVVRLWLERGDGSAGVREPRRPAPPPRAARGMRDEQLDEAIG